MEKDNQMDKLEYEVPKMVDLQIEQKDTQGSLLCGNGSAHPGDCMSGTSPGSGGCGAGTSGT
jgi:hypothetical protein